MSSATVHSGRRYRWEVFAALAVLVVAMSLLTWAKWWPYAHKLPLVAERHALGTSILTEGGGRPPAASLGAGLHYAHVYFLAIWPALVAGLVIAAAVEAVLPDRWLLAALSSDRVRSGVVGGLLALPTMMCTCCAAPVAVGLRRRRASVPAALTYWVSNPALNPVVIAFCVFVLPWQWAALRVGAAVVLVGAIVAYAAGVRGRRSSVVGGPSADPSAAAGDPPATAAAGTGRFLPLRFGRALGRLALRLLPEYLLLVVALGAARAWLFPLGLDRVPTVLLVVGLVVAGTLLPVPTGGEVAVVAALLAGGASAAVAGALLVTLPAVSLPSLLMVRRVFPTRVLAATFAAVAATGVVTAAVAWGVGL